MTNPTTEVHMSAAQSAARIRADLKAAFPGTKFSVRSSTYSQGSSVNVSYVDGPALTAVEAIAEAYGSRGFDGSDDSTYWNKSEHAALTDAGIVSYRCYAFVSVSRKLSDAAKVAIGFDLSRPTWEDGQPAPYTYKNVDLRDLAAVPALMGQPDRIRPSALASMIG